MLHPELRTHHRRILTSRERFDDGYIIDLQSGCWNWIRSLAGSSGYGQMYYNGQDRRAHRVAWILFRGPIPAGLYVLHHCDNPRCVNPDHLFLGTIADNTADMMAKGRDNPRRGERSPHHKLTEEDVREIRSSSLSGAAMARKFQMGEAEISRIRRGVRWKHVHAQEKANGR